MTRRLLILGGTRPARLLATDLMAREIPVLTSLAGATRHPALPEGDLRVGGFGGAEGLITYLTSNDIAAVVDATHPFAARMTDHAARACDQTATPRLVLTRPSWGSRPDAAGWHWADGHAEAGRLAATLGRRIFLSVGRRSAPAYAEALTGRDVALRVAEATPCGSDAHSSDVHGADAHSADVPPTWHIMVRRGPFDRESERALLAEMAIDVLVTKDSGGGDTVAKLDACADAGVAVVIVRRPPLPPGTTAVDSVEAALAWCLSRVEPPPGRGGQVRPPRR